MFWPLQTAARGRKSFLQAPQKCYIGNSKLKWLVQRAPVQWLQVIMMHWRVSLSQHSSEQQTQTILAWRSSLCSYELHPAHGWVYWGRDLSKCLSSLDCFTSSCGLQHGWRLLSSRSFPLLDGCDYVLEWGESCVRSLFFKVAWSILISISKAVPAVWCEW